MKVTARIRMISIVLSTVLMLVQINLCVIADELTALSPDIRFDFFDDLEGMTAEGKQFGGVRSEIVNENGEAVLTGYHTSGKASETIALNTPFVDLGDGGYYMYAKVKYELPDRDTNRCVLWAVSISRKIILIIKFILLFEAWVLPDIHSKFFSQVFPANHASFQLWNVTGGYRQHTKRFYNNK